MSGAGHGGDGGDRYGADVLSGDWRARGRRAVPRVTIERGLVLEHASSGFCGAVTGLEKGLLRLEDRTGRERLFPVSDGWLVDGETVALAVPTAAPAAVARTASGSRAVADARARVARASRILVEGRHDAELVEKVWGDDLRVEGVVVEYLEGVDRLEEVLAEAPPSSERRYGVLVDHLVPGSKEQRIAEAVARGPHGGHVLVVGHPFVDVWEGVRPARVGLERWPDVPRHLEWKHGACEALGLPHADQADIARAWKAILGRVRDYRDLEPALTGRVEQLIDFVTA